MNKIYMLVEFDHCKNVSTICGWYQEPSQKDVISSISTYISDIYPEVYPEHSIHFNVELDYYFIQYPNINNNISLNKDSIFVLLQTTKSTSN